jgi:hypothetical protein
MRKTYLAFATLTLLFNLTAQAKLFIHFEESFADFKDSYFARTVSKKHPIISVKENEDREGRVDLDWDYLPEAEYKKIIKRLEKEHKDEFQESTKKMMNSNASQEEKDIFLRNDAYILKLAKTIYDMRFERNNSENTQLFIYATNITSSVDLINSMINSDQNFYFIKQGEFLPGEYSPTSATEYSLSVYVESENKVMKFSDMINQVLEKAKEKEAKSLRMSSVKYELVFGGTVYSSLIERELSEQYQAQVTIDYIAKINNPINWFRLKMSDFLLYEIVIRIDQSAPITCDLAVWEDNDSLFLHNCDNQKIENASINIENVN